MVLFLHSLVSATGGSQSQVCTVVLHCQASQQYVLCVMLDQVAELVRSPQLPSTAPSVGLGTHSYQGVDLQQYVEVWMAINLVSHVPVQH